MLLHSIIKAEGCDELVIYCYIVICCDDLIIAFPSGVF